LHTDNEEDVVIYNAGLRTRDSHFNQFGVTNMEFYSPFAYS